MDKPQESCVACPETPRVSANYFDAQLTFNRFQDKLEEVALRIFNKPITKEMYRITCSSRMIKSQKTNLEYHKNSYHVIIADYGHLPNLNQYHKKFAELLVESFQNDHILNKRLMVSGKGLEYLAEPVDSGVYKSNQPFRCIFCTKPNKNSFLTPDSKDNDKPISDYFVGWITETDPLLDISKLDIETAHTNAIQKRPMTEKVIPETLDIDCVPPHLIEYVKLLLGYLNPQRAVKHNEWFNVACTLYSVHTGLFNIFDKWSSTAPNYDEVSCQKLWKTLYQSNYSLKSLSKLATTDGYQPEDHIHLGYTFKYFYQKPPRNTFEKSIENDYWGATLITNNTSSFVDIDLVNLIDKMRSGCAQTIVLKAPCGSAKTDFIVKLTTLLSHGGDLPRNFLVINPLRTLAYSIQGRFTDDDKKPYDWKQGDPDPKTLDLKLYTELKTTEDLIDTNINIVINSLPKLSEWDLSTCLDHYQRDLIIIDEWKSFLLNLCGQTLNGRRRQVLSHLQYYLKNAKYVIVLDQNIDDDCLECLYYLRNPKTSIISNPMLVNKLFMNYQISKKHWKF